MPDDLTKYDLTRRTPGEELFLWRRRHRLNQAEAAKKLRTIFAAYKEAELDHGNLGLIRHVSPSAGDLCRLARRRSGLELRAAAGEIGTSHRWLLHRERADDPRLVAWWVGRGYQFEPAK